MSCDLTYAANSLIIIAVNNINANVTSATVGGVAATLDYSVQGNIDPYYFLGIWIFHLYKVSGGTSTVTIIEDADDIIILSAVSFTNTRTTAPFTENMATNSVLELDTFDTLPIGAIVTTGTTHRLLFQDTNYGFEGGNTNATIALGASQTEIAHVASHQGGFPSGALIALETNYLAIDASHNMTTTLTFEPSGEQLVDYSTVAFGILGVSTPATTGFTSQQIILMSLIPIFLLIGIIGLLIKKRGMSS